MRFELHAGSVHLRDLLPRDECGIIVVYGLGDEEERAAEAETLQKRKGIGIGICIAIIEGDDDRPGRQICASGQVPGEIVERDRLVAFLLQVAKLLLEFERGDRQILPDSVGTGWRVRDMVVHQDWDPGLAIDAVGCWQQGRGRWRIRRCLRGRRRRPGCVRRRGGEGGGVRRCTGGRG